MGDIRFYVVAGAALGTSALVLAMLLLFVIR
jgi:hypothetical protein